MRILLIHQNFPGQFRHLAPALAARGHEVVALTPRAARPATWRGVRLVPYRIRGRSAADIHPWLADFETKVIRGQACHDAARRLAAQGFRPDVILAHHGWGESLFLKDVWPDARLGLYCEFYYSDDAAQLRFDPEFAPPGGEEEDAPRMRLRNLNNRLHFEIASAGISPTRFQADSFPLPFRESITVCHDGIDTDLVAPLASARLTLEDGRTLGREDEVITFVNRNLEPYRGYHVFMRALPELLRRRPRAQVVILGGDGTSYGRPPTGGRTWKQVFIDEVRPRIATDDWARVHFPGRVPYERFLATLRVSRVHVYLTYPFVLGWSLLEAMAAGCAIVASDTEPVREVIADGRTGWLTDFLDPAGLAERIDRLLDDAEARAEMGRAAREHVVSRYDLRRVCLPRQLEWIDSLAGAEAPRPRT